jgi:hypothetical protein
VPRRRCLRDVCIGDGPVEHAHPDVGEANFGGIGQNRVLDEGLALARKILRVRDEAAPQFAAFPVAVVGGVVAEAEEDGERQADEGEGDRRERDFQGAEVAVRDRNGDGEENIDEQDFPDAGEDGAAEDEEEVEGAGPGTEDHGGCSSDQNGIASGTNAMAAASPWYVTAIQKDNLLAS